MEVKVTVEAIDDNGTRRARKSATLELSDDCDVERFLTRVQQGIELLLDVAEAARHHGWGEALKRMKAAGAEDETPQPERGLEEAIRETNVFFGEVTEDVVPQETIPFEESGEESP